MATSSQPPLGSTLHLGAELLKLREGLDKVAIVFYPGGGQAVLGILGGNVELCSSSLAPVHALIKDGRLKGLAILGDRRWHDLPDVPTAEEAGYKDFNFETCTALMAPVNTPPRILRSVERATLDALAKAELREKIVSSGFLVQAKTGEEHMARLVREVPVYRDIIKRAGIKAM